MPSDALKTAIQERYGEAARQAATVKAGGGCCGGACGADPITTNLYGEDDRRGLPSEAINASLGCGNPTALIDLHPGETVLDLGSGGGIDVLLSARRVGPTGKVYGLDMTDDMLALARDNQRKAGVTNVEFLKGDIEEIPLPDRSVDVIISNCVINLSPDKDRVLSEAYRVLKPGGRFAVSDIVVRGEIPPAVRQSVELWIGCVAGALEETEYRERLARAGFSNIDIEAWRVYEMDQLRDRHPDRSADFEMPGALNPHGSIASAFIRAVKPDAAPGSAPEPGPRYQ
jgi:SAM-dependent methyltransferase